MTNTSRGLKVDKYHDKMTVVCLDRNPLTFLLFRFERRLCRKQRARIHEWI